MSNGCVSLLSSYADFLSNNPGTPSPRPHPLIFSGTNCSGSQLFLFNESVSEGVHTLPFPGFGSFWLPSNTLMILQSGSNMRTICPSPTSTLIADTTAYLYEAVQSDCTQPPLAPPVLNGVSTKDNVTQVTIHSLVPYILLPYTTSCWTLDTCNQKILNTLGTSTITSYAQGSEECDAFMTTFCAGTSGYQCSADTRAGDNLLLPECACVLDEKEIANAFCQPGNTNPRCSDVGALVEFIPTTCFGKSCSFGGYRFNKLLNQQCNTTLCQQIVDVLGSELVVNADSVVYCGTVPPVSTSPSVQPFESVPQPWAVQSWQYVLIAVGCIAAVFVVICGVYIWQRDRAQSELNSLSSAPS